MNPDSISPIIYRASAIGQVPETSVRLGQYNLFTGELEAVRSVGDGDGLVPETGWLFDPDWGLVLPEDVAGREVVVDQGVVLAFPARSTRKHTSDKGRVTNDRYGQDGNGQNAADVVREPLIFGLPKRAAWWALAQRDEPPAVCKTADCAQLILSGFGIYLGKKSERLVVKLSGKTVYEFPLFRISEVVVASRGVSLSSDLVKEFCERGIRMSFVEPSGRPYAMLSSPILTATVQSRREQLLAFNDARGLEFARVVVRGKIRNQRHLLLYFGKYLKQADPARFEVIAEIAKKLRGLELQARRVEGASVEEKRQELMGLEGVAGRLYWQAVREIVEGRVEFMGRAHRGATDTVNALLNYGYGILYAHVWGAVVNAGLEPFAGFLHVDRPGKPSLVLDLVEEFRQPVVDRAVIAFINLGQPIGMRDGLLDLDTRRAIGEKILERLASPEPFRGQQFQIRSIIQMQARTLVSFLRGKCKYKPFSFRW